MKPSVRYVKIVEWSDEDQCYVGSCPGLFYGGCHCDDEKEVFSELCELVEEMIKLYGKEGKNPTVSYRRKGLRKHDVENRLIPLSICNHDREAAALASLAYILYISSSQLISFEACQNES